MDIFSSGALQDEESMLLWSFSPEPDCLDATTEPAPAPAPPPPPEVASRSAFSRYTGAQAATSAATLTGGGGGGGDRNAHRRVVDILRRIPRPGRGGAGPQDHGSRGFRHMMRERQRREKMSQCYADLYSILPYVQKGDKISIVQTAAAYIQHLKGRKEGLQVHNEELIKKRSGARQPKEEEDDDEVTKIKLRKAVDPVSTIDSMIGALRCLKAMDVKARAVSLEFSGCELTAVVSIETGDNVVGNLNSRS